MYKKAGTHSFKKVKNFLILKLENFLIWGYAMILIWGYAKSNKLGCYLKIMSYKKILDFVFNKIVYYKDFNIKIKYCRNLIKYIFFNISHHGMT